MGCAPSDHPATVKLTKLARELREATNKDPLLMHLGVSLPKDVEVVVVFGRKANAFVFPDDPGKIYVTSGMLKIGATRDELMSVLAHEQAHQIYYAIINRGKANASPEPTQRFGEAIWRPPEYAGIGIYEARDRVCDRISRKGEEGYCDTHGALPHLNRLGIDGASMSSFLAKLGSPSPNEAPVYGSLAHSIESLVRSHPPTPDRLWQIRQILYQTAYPASLDAGQSSAPRSESLALEIPHDQTAYDFARSLELDTGLFSLWLSRSLVLGFPHNIIGNLPKPALDVEKYRMFLLGLPKDVPDITQDDTGDPRSHFIYRSSEQDTGLATLLNSFLKKTVDRHNKAEGSEEITLEIGEAIKFQVAIPLGDLPDVASFVESWQKRLSGTSENIAQELSTLGQALNSGAVPAFLGARLGAALAAIMNEGTIKDIEFGPVGYYCDWEKSLKNLVNEKIAQKSPIKVDPKDIEVSTIRAKPGQIEWLATRINTLTAIRIADFFSDLQKLVEKMSTAQENLIEQWLALLDRNTSDFDSPIGPLITSGEISARVFELLCYRWGVGELMEQDEPKRILTNLAERGLATAWRDFREDMRRRDSLSQPKLFEEFRPDWFDPKDPRALVPVNKITQRNQHEHLAEQNNLINPDLTLHNDLKDKASSIKEVLIELNNHPKLFSAGVWENIARVYISSVEDLGVLLGYLDETFKQHKYIYSPWRDRTLCESRCAVLTIAIPNILGSNLDQSAIAAIIEQLKDTPRCAARNLAVKALLDRVNSTDQPDQLFSLMELLELDPPHTIGSNLLHSWKITPGSARLMDLEREISLLDKAGLRVFVPWDALEAETPEEQIQIGQKSGTPTPGDPGRGTMVFQLFHSEEGCTYELLGGGFPEINRIKRHLGAYATSTMIRNTYLKRCGQDIPSPASPLRLKPESVTVVDESAYIVRQALHLLDPLGQNKDNNPDLFKSRDRLRGHYEYTLKKLLPIATPLRDEWILHMARQSEQMSPRSALSGGDLRRLQLECYLPETKQALGELLWKRFSRHVGRESGSGLSTKMAVRYLGKVMPYYSTERNEAIRECLKLTRDHDYSDAVVLDALFWVPGQEKPIPSQDTVIGSSFLEAQLAVLGNFDHFERVAALLYLTRVVDEKPFSVDYIERLLGGTLDESRSEQQKLSASARFELIARVLGGPDGVFVSEDKAALSYLKNAIVAQITEASPKIKQHEKVADEVIADILWRAKLPVQIRMQVLAAFIDWHTSEPADANEHKVVADLIYTAFSAMGAPGIRMLQGLVIEPKAFSPEVSIHLRRSQDSVEPGPAATPFHLAFADVNKDITLGTYRGGGTMAEVRSVLSINEQPQRGVVLKTLRPDILRRVSELENPMNKISYTLHRHGFPWGQSLIRRVIDSCRNEYEAFSAEADRTGKPMADLFSKILKASQESIDHLIHLKLDSGLEIVIPSLVRANQSVSNRFSFCMGDLGHGYRSFATLLQDERIGQTGLEDYLKRSGIKLSEVADATATLFVSSLIDHNTLLKDLHFGNTGLITEDTTSRIGMVDFGGVQDNFPQIDKLWILSFISELVQGNEAKQIELLMAAAMRSGETNKQELKQLLPKAKDLVAQIGRTREQESSESMIEVCEGLLADIYDNWPLPNSVRNFVESLRKVGREWGPHISSECQEKIGLYLFNHLMTST
ncbi:MAG: M48 family metalloprotease, partial [Pseudomonadota bacterium]